MTGQRVVTVGVGLVTIRALGVGGGGNIFVGTGAVATKGTSRTNRFYSVMWPAVISQRMGRKKEISFLGRPRLTSLDQSA